MLIYFFFHININKNLVYKQYLITDCEWNVADVKN